MTSTLRKLPKIVVLLGLVSLLNDLSSEIIYPLIPLFVTQTLHGSAIALGIIEGAAESAASLLQVASGLLSDRWKQRHPIVLAGYALAGLVRPLIAISTSVWHVLVLRVLDRTGKGIRTAPRDAMIADSVSPHLRGVAFGFHRAMDNLGASLGPLVATSLLYVSHKSPACCALNWSNTCHT